MAPETPLETPAAVTIGTFDGVHRGHQALLNRAHEFAQSQELTSVALTFRRPPQNELGSPKPLLLSPEEKLKLLGEHVDRVGALDFQEVRWLSPEAFVAEILQASYRARHVVTGPDFRFGRDRSGDVETLRSLGADYGMTVDVVDPVQVDGRAVSSTAIRELLREGAIADATELLGRWPRLVGRVVSGAGEGRRIGYPTANLDLDPEVLVPADGIYAAWTRDGTKTRASALYVGERPTYRAHARSVEVHLLDHPERSLHDQTLTVELVARVRPDQTFDSVEALKSQIAADLDEVRRVLSHPG